MESDHLDLHTAAKAGDADEVAAVLSMDNRLVHDHDADGWTALHLAAHYGHLEAVELLLHNNTPVDIRSKNRLANTPLHAALAGRRAEVARALVEAGADVNARQHGGWTPLQQAAANGDGATVEYLLAKGADVNAANDAGVTALALATEQGHTQVVELLRRRGAR
jgi:ankyrin repeat protein